MLTQRQVADRLGVSVRRVRALREAGRLTGEKVGRDWLYRAEAVAELAALPRPTGRPKLSQPPLA